MELERKSVANSISLLQELDYDIVKGDKGGFALLSRNFDSSEVTFLVDAIFYDFILPSTDFSPTGGTRGWRALHRE